MCDEVIRVGNFFYIQTPYKYFPLEPHYLILLFQFFPKFIQIWLLQHFNLGHIKRIKNYNEAKIQINEIKLLSIKEFEFLFKDTKYFLFKEKLLFFTKSITIHNFIN